MYRDFEFYEMMLSGMQSKERYQHSIGVAKEAMKLARIYGQDEVKARYAGLLHDITKEENFNSQLKLAKKYGIIVGNIEKACPKMLHQITGAGYVRHELGIEDEDICAAIESHTTGKVAMTMFEKIIFIADLTEENRDFDDIEMFRELAYKDIDKAMLYALDLTIRKIIDSGAILHPRTMEARNHMVFELSKR